MSSYMLETFVHEMRDAVSAEKDTKLIVDAVSEGVRRLLGGAFFPAEAFLTPGSDGFARHELFRDARMVISTCVWLPGHIQTRMNTGDTVRFESFSVGPDTAMKIAELLAAAAFTEVG